MDIHTIPLSERCTITVFYDKAGDSYSLSKSGEVLYYQGKYIATSFSNRRLSFKAHRLYNYTKLTDAIITTLFKDADIPPTDFNELLKANIPNVILDDNLWIIVPKTNKKLSGKPFDMEFEVGAYDFGYGTNTMVLQVFMTPITIKSKSVKFSVEIPDFLYNKCMLIPDVEKRPLTKYIEANTIRQER